MESTKRYTITQIEVYEVEIPAHLEDEAEIYEYAAEVAGMPISSEWTDLEEVSTPRGFREGAENDYEND